MAERAQERNAVIKAQWLSPQANATSNPHLWYLCYDEFVAKVLVSPAVRQVCVRAAASVAVRTVVSQCSLVTPS